MTVSTQPRFTAHWFARLLAGLAVACAPLLLAGGAHALSGEQPQMGLQRVDITAGMYRIDAQLAQTPKEREIGLMHRATMAQQEGMLFKFDKPGVQCFWMKNTLLPLTAAFVEDDGTVVNLADMQPQALDSHCSEKPVRFVLEMNQGWFESRGIKPGFRLTGAVFAAPAPKR